VKTSSDRMVKCWIPKIYLSNPSTEPSTTEAWRTRGSWISVAHNT
jgi:hypothetical protein